MKVLRLILVFYLFSTVFSDNIVTNTPNYNTELLFTASPGQETQGCQNSKTLIKKLNDLLAVLKEKNISEEDSKVAKIYNALDLIKEYLEETPNGLENQELFSKFKNLKERLQKDEMAPIKQNLRNLPEEDSKGNVKTKIVFKYELPSINQPNCKEAFMKLIQSAHNAYLKLAKNPMCDDNSGNLPKENAINNNVQSPNIYNDYTRNDRDSFYITSNGNTAPSNEFVRYVANQAFNQNPNNMMSILQNYRPGDNGNWPNNNQMAYLTSEMPYSVLYNPTTIQVNQLSTTPKSNDVPNYNQDSVYDNFRPNYNPLDEDFSSNLEHAKSLAEELKNDHDPKTAYYDNILNNELISEIADRNSAGSHDISENTAPIISNFLNNPNVSGNNSKHEQSEPEVDPVEEMIKKLTHFEETFTIKHSKPVLQNTSNVSVMPLSQNHNNKIIIVSKNPNQKYNNIQPGSFIPNPYTNIYPDQRFLYQQDNIILNSLQNPVEHLQQSNGPPHIFKNDNPVSSKGFSSIQNFNLLNPYEKKLFYEKALGKLNTVLPNQEENSTGPNLNGQNQLLYQQSISGILNPTGLHAEQNFGKIPYQQQNLGEIRFPNKEHDSGTMNFNVPNQNQNSWPNKQQNLANLNPYNANQLINIPKLVGSVNLNAPSFEQTAYRPNFGIANNGHRGLSYKYNWNLTGNLNPNKMLFPQIIYGSNTDPNFGKVRQPIIENSDKQKDLGNVNNLNQLLYQQSISEILKPTGLQPEQKFGKIPYQKQNFGEMGLAQKQYDSGTMSFTDPSQLLYQQNVVEIVKPKEPNLGQNVGNTGVISNDKSKFPNKQYIYKNDYPSDTNQLLYHQSVVGIAKPKGQNAGQNVENNIKDQQTSGKIKPNNPNQAIYHQIVAGILNPEAPNLWQNVKTQQYEPKNMGVINNSPYIIIPNNQQNSGNVNPNYNPNPQYQPSSQNSGQVIENYPYDPKLAVIGLDGQSRWPNAKQQSFGNPAFNGKHLVNYPHKIFQFSNPNTQYLNQQPVGIKPSYSNSPWAKHFVAQNPYNQTLYQHIENQNYGYTNIGPNVLPKQQTLGIFNGVDPNKNQNFGYINPRGIVPNYGQLNNYAVGDNLANLKPWASMANMYNLRPVTGTPSIIELTYLLKRPQSLIYQPYYYVKYRLPYYTFLTDVKNILLKKPYLRTNPMKLYQELIPSSNISEVSPEIEHYPKDDILKLIARDGTSVKAQIIEGNDTVLQEQLRTVQYLNANLGQNNVVHALDDMINFHQYETAPKETSETRNESTIIQVLAATDLPKVEVESTGQEVTIDPPKLNIISLRKTELEHNNDARINSDNDTVTFTEKPANDSLVVSVQPNVNVSQHTEMTV